MIKVLNKELANKIAAGEVINDPKAVVKELVENSIDAGATSITCEIKKGGKEYIRITDNGCGIEKDETTIAFKKHATGKISVEEDLNNINTLGFRGEALGSIAAVSSVELLTKTKESKAGTRVVIDAGDFIDNKSVGCEDGTTFIVRRLFFNIPARLKFLKSDGAETNKITDFISKIAIAYPDINFKYIVNNKILFNTRGDGDRLKAILTVFGGSLKNKLIEVNTNDDNGFQLLAFVSDPLETRPSKKQQIYFVNGRLVQSKTLETAVSNAYKQRVFKGRYPVVFMFLDVPADSVDVNIHPSKKEIRFYDEDAVLSFVEKSISDTLKSGEGIPEIRPITNNSPSNEQFCFQEKRHATIREADTITQNSSETNSRETIENNKKSQLEINSILAKLREDSDKEYSTIEKENTFNANKNNDDNDDNKYNSNSIYSIDTDSKPGVTNPFSFSDLEILGILFDTYIIATKEDIFYLVDQHAAHERINYERILESFRSDATTSQMLLVPIVFECNIQQEQWYDNLVALGFVIEHFGPGIYRITEIPYAFNDINITQFINDYLSETSSSDCLGMELNHKVATLACKQSIKANDKISQAEAKQLFVELESCDNPFSCPHGRPTFIKMTKYEIERNFMRK